MLGGTPRSVKGKGQVGEKGGGSRALKALDQDEQHSAQAGASAAATLELLVLHYFNLDYQLLVHAMASVSPGLILMTQATAARCFHALNTVPYGSLPLLQQARRALPCNVMFVVKVNRSMLCFAYGITKSYTVHLWSRLASGPLKPPVGAVHILCDESDSNSRHRLHAKPTQDLYMAVTTSDKNHIL